METSKEKDVDIQTEKTQKEEKVLTPVQIQRRKKMLVYPLFFLIFVGSMYLIFAPSSDKKEIKEGTKGFNAELPKPKEEGIVGDKMKAYQDEQMNQKKEEKMKTLQDFAIATGMETTLPVNGTKYHSEKETSSMNSSTAAYRQMNKQLTTFYQPSKQPEENQDMLALEYRIQELENKQKVTERKKGTANEQLDLMEKSYQMAAKYIGPEKQQQSNATAIQTAPVESKLSKSIPCVKVSTFHERVVSGLSQNVSDSAFVIQYSKPRNYGFHTAVGNNETSVEKNSIKACIYENQVITDGQGVRLRLEEPLQAGKMLVPRNTLIIGTAKLQGERLEITVSSLEYNGNIIPVELTVYDVDGQKGIFIPGSMEGDAMREALGNMGSGLGTSISFAQSAGQQIAMDLTRGAMQGASTYLGKKLRQVKIKLKAGHQVLLLAKEK
ncbi:conjugative transposon protein TraM [Bacteroides graminisolvens]|jgi:conjugative transposon TraM protein|uniref:conjugative transposon protein TraM n=1 Tax=Bacteroides graminisolvens TaxID=477666 RepID=UPI0023F2B6EE|nr:conjugative transposon protein TraM [Bacteroides graminisolvens]MDD3210864.1 conjugative transposon protein TraM [Bacteroides graminisolvens]